MKYDTLLWDSSSGVVVGIALIFIAYHLFQLAVNECEKAISDRSTAVLMAGLVMPMFMIPIAVYSLVWSVPRLWLILSW
jgi:hypothetical protein